MSFPLVVRDLAILIGRLGVGVVFIAHGWQKLADSGIENVAAGFDQMGVPLATAAAWFAAIVELVGGAALVLGVATPLAGVLLALNMAGAYAFAHAGNGIFVDEGGAELVLVLGVASLVFAAVGAGRVSVDHVVAPKFRGTSRPRARRTS